MCFCAGFFAAKFFAPHVQFCTPLRVCPYAHSQTAWATDLLHSHAQGARKPLSPRPHHALLIVCPTHQSSGGGGSLQPLIPISSRPISCRGLAHSLSPCQQKIRHHPAALWATESNTTHRWGSGGWSRGEQGCGLAGASGGPSGGITALCGNSDLWDRKERA